ncbi:MAG: cyanophycin synthetase [Candidatus Marinimicrobia bacterium]|jgi:cyanophycin synthetase|nr:cyanophycin synthetase [Candidatus Neomarinimicrobiota bacterium]MBT3618722.1 cyanophycin synthetase [Candidatus Neomarinimicrobiota bacterium]MBT3828289.1 cyanophycin synthetase [Candidatus Neomarinimicrobiota bacterium]MBT3997250.1 cyanophycin synthetase [Candidatus Neomarinimicrobiota bacterium]MBT4280152.1 cyanophycin synthetase [Candidatus Neomarinimicrobiota bacterium]
MKILETNVYVGPNVYARFPVIRHILDLGVLEDWPTAKLGKKFIDGLVHYLPDLKNHGCSYREEGGFLRRMKEDEGTWLGHVMEHVAIELQNVAGSKVTFGKTRSLEEKGQYNMVFQYLQRDVGLEASRLAQTVILDLLPEKVKNQLDVVPGKFDFEEERDMFIRFAQKFEFGPSTASLVDAAIAREIPWLRLNRYSLVQFGHGKYQKRIQATITNQTRHISVEIASDKDDTNSLLSDLGLPVPIQKLVYTDKEAVHRARRIGYPVVLKPLNANHGRGVSINLTEDSQVVKAFKIARERGSSRGVLVESFITGFDHRMLVVDGKLIAVAKRVPGRVVGNGKHTIQELLDIVNEDPRRGIGHEKVLTQIQIDHQAERLMKAKEYTLDSVLKKDEILYLRSTANLSTGGTSIDMTDLVHPDNKSMAERAVKAIGLDVGGVDFLTDDITQSHKVVGGAIVEVNAAPGFRMHVAPSEGEPRDVAGPVMDMLFPQGTPSVIPIAGITGTNGKTTTTRMLAHIMKTAGHTVGFTTTDGVYIDGHLTVKGDMTGPKSAQMVLRDPDVDMAVLETARGGILRSGLGYEKSDVAACLNISADHLGLRGVETLDQLAEAKRVVVETATDTAVLNADDEYCLKMADYTKAEHVCYVTMNPEHELVKQHIRAGGRAVVLEKGINGEMITFYDKGAHIPLLWTHLIPATLEGKALHNVQNAMFASAMAYSLNKTLEDISHGLRTFNQTFFQAPGKMNIFDEHPFKVILDYAHNPAAVRAISSLVSKLEVNGKRIAVLSAPGDRRDEDIRKVAEIASEHFDVFICKADDHRRGRDDDEVPKIMKSALLGKGINKENIQVIPDEQDAINTSLKIAEEDDCVLILGDEITRSWKQIIHFESKTNIPAEKSTSFETPDTGLEETPFTIEEGQKLIQDERGVRLAKEESD